MRSGGSVLVGFGGVYGARVSGMWVLPIVVCWVWVCDCCVDDLCCRLFGVGLFCCEVLLDRFRICWLLFGGICLWHAFLLVWLVGGGWFWGLCLNLNAV